MFFRILRESRLLILTYCLSGNSSVVLDKKTCTELLDLRMPSKHRIQFAGKWHIQVKAKREKSLNLDLLGPRDLKELTLATAQHIDGRTLWLLNMHMSASELEIRHLFPKFTVDKVSPVKVRAGPWP